MSYTILQTDPAALSTEDLFAEIDGFKVLAVEVVERLSLILKELRARRQSHHFFQDRILCFWESIANGALAAEAAILLANRNTIKAVLPLPRDRQIAIAHGENVAVATLTRAGEIKSDDMPIHRMDPQTLTRAFGPGGIRPVHEQAEMIREAGKIERHGAITVLRDETMLKIGNQKIRPEDLRGPLMALGYTLDLTRRGERRAG